MYQALYRKWRPQIFDDVIGQEHITRTLKNQVKTGRLSHAYIFIGTRGTGKTTCARILAKAVNCEHPVDGNPCGVCPACRAISDGTAMDVVELDAASYNGVDNVRALREEALFSPVALKKRVYIIDEVHMLSTPAFNALLKILEEPPEHLLFILATTELQKVPATILSRCQRHSFRRIDTEKIAAYLSTIAAREGFDLRPDAAELIARLAEGGVRDALSLLDQCSGAQRIDLEAVYSAMGLAGNARISALLDQVLKHDVSAALQSFSAMWMDGKDPATFLGELSGLLRDILMLHVSPKSGRKLISGGYDMAMLDAFAGRMTTEELLCAMGTVQSTLSGMKDVKNPKTAVELCLVSLCDNTLGESVSELRARISRLEEKLSRGLAVQAVPVKPEADEWEDFEEPEYLSPSGYEEPEDEIDPDAFYEEQPEDAFIGRTEAEPIQEQPQAAPPEEPGISDTELWERICERAKGTLPMDLRISLSDETRIRGRLDGHVLRLEAAPGFMYSRFNKPDILAEFAEAVKALTQKDVNVQLSELQPKERQHRSLDELRKFDEVKFV